MDKLAVPLPDLSVNVNVSPGATAFELHSGGVITVFPFSVVIVPPALQSPVKVSPLIVLISNEG